jgi:DNA modification methylase
MIKTDSPMEQGADWTLVNGDCIQEMEHLADDAVDLSVYSPPFIALYTYTDSEHDMGNSATTAEFFEHFGYMQRALLRVTKPGRITCVHVAQVPAMLSRDGYIGMKDFRGDTIRAYEANGWIYHGEVCIDKDPQAQAIRTKSKSLLFVQLRKDSSWMRMALADYILLFRKHGENPSPVLPDITNEEWIEWARPIWYGIRESDTLQVAEARADDDERHVCPLQLGTIERCVRLWSNPGDLVLSPFAGIGSEGYESVRLGRRFLGIELKATYYELAIKNMRAAEGAKAQGTLFQAGA